MNKTDRTKEVYGFLWNRVNKETVPPKWHFNAMQEVIDEPIVRGRIGIEVGSGCGYDTYIIAKNNPYVNLVSMDISEGIYSTQKLISDLNNVMLMQCSALSIPVKNEVFDFAYSFGVLHHTSDPRNGLLEINRILKKESPAFLYLYEDHSENFIKYLALKIITCLRFITTRLPKKVLYLLSWAMSPLVFIIFTLPSKLLGKFKSTKSIAEKMPFNFGTTPFSLRGDLYDRFSAPIEYRFSRNGIYNMFTECGFSGVIITRLKAIAGWVVYGYKA